jgi:hypothetical protein
MDIDQIIEDFDVLDSWDDRYRYVIELGRKLAPLPEAARIESNKVQGCASQVWFTSDTRPARRAYCKGTDCHPVRVILRAIRTEDSGYRRNRDFRTARSQGTSDSTTFERFSFDGRSHQVGCPGRAR